jgi:hypothetical protein
LNYEEQWEKAFWSSVCALVAFPLLIALIGSSWYFALVSSSITIPIASILIVNHTGALRGRAALVFDSSLIVASFVCVTGLVVARSIPPCQPVECIEGDVDTWVGELARVEYVESVSPRRSLECV